MNGWLTTGSLTAASILVGMEAVYGLWSLQEKEEAFHRIWYSKRLYQAAALCLAVFCGIWMALRKRTFFGDSFSDSGNDISDSGSGGWEKKNCSGSDFALLFI